MSSFVGEDDHTEKCKRCIAIPVNDVVKLYRIMANVEFTGSRAVRGFRWHLVGTILVFIKVQG